ncbi:hypothetical protein CEXT_746731 [Caerostris extrusa]|uniref:Uncharacterized protein n=1 Tax=Caerostris extrusa TaxID=172846 RepID=A0AAV4NR85_CAEEX|nr:hypothetical protein CEXT_746731 [Caerostris extrusa]
MSTFAPNSLKMLSLQSLSSDEKQLASAKDEVLDGEKPKRKQSQKSDARKPNNLLFDFVNTNFAKVSKIEDYEVI